MVDQHCGAESSDIEAKQLATRIASKPMPKWMWDETNEEDETGAWMEFKMTKASGQLEVISLKELIIWKAWAGWEEGLRLAQQAVGEWWGRHKDGNHEWSANTHTQVFQRRTWAAWDLEEAISGMTQRDQRRLDGQGSHWIRCLRKKFVCSQKKNCMKPSMSERDKTCVRKDERALKTCKTDIFFRILMWLILFIYFIYLFWTFTHNNLECEET